MSFSLNRVTPSEMLETLKPKFLLLELLKGRRTFRWAVPLWALRECLALGLKALALAPYVLSPARLKQYRLDGYVSRSDPNATLETLFDELPDLELPRGEAYLDIETRDVKICLRQI